MTFERWWSSIGSTLLLGYEDSNPDAIKNVCKMSWNGAVRASHDSFSAANDHGLLVVKEKIKDLEARL